MNHASATETRHITQDLGRLADFLRAPEERLRGHLAELEADAGFLADLDGAARGVPGFAPFTSVHDFRLFRPLLYLAIRLRKPRHVVETGVLNGFNTAFCLLALDHNGAGELTSIDLPADERILAQGNRPLPPGKAPGWIVPARLRSRWDFRAGDAREALPAVLAAKRPLDLFIHDSDHSAEHMRFEMEAAWEPLSAGGLMVVDNVEANDAFRDFTRARGLRHAVFASLEPSRGSQERPWLHGLALKPEARA
jgi:predicted O-methyltransferase YrrM